MKPMSIEDLLSDLSKVIPKEYFSDVKVRVDAFAETNNFFANSKRFEVMDEVTGSRLNIDVSIGAYGLNIQPEGYSDLNGGAPVTIDFFSSEKNPADNLNVLVWSDQNQEDYTHKISLKDAKNTEITKTLEDAVSEVQKMTAKSPTEILK